MADKPLVSIVTPTYNAEGYLRATVVSVQAQEMADWELILVDDASTDGSVKVAGALAADDPRIHVIVLPGNAGPAVARNRGIATAQGRYIAFLDCDDLWMPDKLTKQLAFMQAHGAVIGFTAYRMLSGGTREPIGVQEVVPTVTYAQLLYSNIIGCSTVMVDRAKAGEFRFPQIRKRQDFALWLKLLRQHGAAHGLAEVLTEYTVRPNSVSSNRFSAAAYTWRVYREVEKLPWYRAMYYFTHYALRGLKKYWL